MTLKVFVAAALFVAVPIVAFAQSDKPNAQSSKPTIEDVQKLVETIGGDTLSVA
jgi:type IV secretory pathway VirB2 component (pilin)